MIDIAILLTYAAATAPTADYIPLVGLSPDSRMTTWRGIGGGSLVPAQQQGSAGVRDRKPN